MSGHTGQWRVRLAAGGDADDLALLEAAAFGPASWGEDSVKASLREPNVATVLAFGQGGGLPAGFAMLMRAADEGEILSLGVAPLQRLKGVGDALLCEVLRIAVRAGLSKIFLEVDTSNAAARALYEKHRFQQIGERREYYRDGANAMVMGKTLGD